MANVFNQGHLRMQLSDDVRIDGVHVGGNG
jgi:hypothetical protein